MTYFFGLIFQTYQDSLHAIWTCQGVYFRFKFYGIQVQENLFRLYLSMTSMPNWCMQWVTQQQPPEQDPSTICSLSALNRQTWHSVRMEILNAGEKEQFLLNDGECHSGCFPGRPPAPADLANLLNAVRLGDTCGRSLRCYDKVCKNK